MGNLFITGAAYPAPLYNRTLAPSRDRGLTLSARFLLLGFSLSNCLYSSVALEVSEGTSFFWLGSVVLLLDLDRVSGFPLMFWLLMCCLFESVLYATRAEKPFGYGFKFMLSVPVIDAGWRTIVSDKVCFALEVVGVDACWGASLPWS
ncbi:hypothetical protein DM860_008894 [Cuscuta australis]|uniref:Uncharacterized protein n=1 Tax=Cuscuta australis TaxID=267555 RepID=A0A328D795_9ASTE|nr:hypothetical protein DM860_008894 [Cuscuta australis]